MLVETKTAVSLFSDAKPHLLVSRLLSKDLLKAPEMCMFKKGKKNANNWVRALLPPGEEILVSSISTTTDLLRCCSTSSSPFSSMLLPAALRTAGQGTTPCSSTWAQGTHVQLAGHHGTACPLQGTHLGPSPAPAADFYDIQNHFRNVQFAWNGPKLRSHEVKTQASSPSAVAAFQITLPSLIPKW